MAPLSPGSAVCRATAIPDSGSFTRSTPLQRALREREGCAAKPPCPRRCTGHDLLDYRTRRESISLPNENEVGRYHEEPHRRPGAGARTCARGRGGEAGLGVPGHGQGSTSSPLRSKQGATRAARQHALDHARQGGRHVRYPELVPQHVPADARDRSIRQQGEAGARLRLLSSADRHGPR